MATEQPNAEIQLNYPPTILGATEGVTPDPLVPQPVRGLPLSLFRMVFNQKLGVLANAVTVLVPPPAREGTGNDPISIGLVLNGNPLEEEQIPDDDRDKTTSFYLFESTLRDGSNNKLEYKVRRPTGNVGDSTPLYLLYRSHLPGGNSVPGDDDHPYLDISLPAELGDPAMIGKDEMDAGVPLTVFYPFMYDYDVIHYKLQSERFTYIVQPREAGSPVVIPLTRAMFELAGNSANFEISYTVISQLNNPTDKRRESKTLLAEVDKDLHFFAKPILREVQSESGDNPAIIDRGKLAGNPLLAVVVPSAPKFKPGDTVEGRYTATPSGTNQPFTGTIEEDGFGGFKPCIMYIPNDKVVANDDVVATYSLLRGGTVVGKSDKAEAHVKGEDSIALDPPTLKSPATNPINVLEYDLGVTAQVTFAGNPGDQARLKELNPAPGAVPFPTQDIIAGQSDFNLSQTYLAVRQNSVIELTWELIRGGVRTGESAALRLNVNRMIDGDPRLTTPTAPPGNITSTLDLSSFTGNTTAQLKAWRGIALGQSLWQSCEGTNSSGAPVTLPIYQGVPIGSVGDQSGVVTRAFLEQLADGSQIRVLAAVNFDGVANEATAVKFPLRTYTVKAVALENPTITSVQDSRGPLANPGTTVDTSVILSGTASKGLEVEIFDGTVSKDKARADASNGIWTLTVSGLTVTEHRFTAKALYGSEATSQEWILTVVPAALKVMGARFNRSTFFASRFPRKLSAFNETTGEPMQVEWQYAGDSQWQTADSWRDTAPHKPLRVRSQHGQLTLNPANIVGNGDEYNQRPAAFVAHRDNGDVVGWGTSSFGGDVPSSISMADIVEVSAARAAFAIRRANGRVLAWGNSTTGGDMGPTLPMLDFAEVLSASGSFAGLLVNGGVVAWGHPNSGATVPEAIARLSDVRQIIATDSAYAGLRATGHVVAWGDAWDGGNIPADIAALTDVKEIIGSAVAFIALRSSGQIVGWGNPNYGGTVPAEIAALTDVVELGCASVYAFTAIRATGQVVAWGMPTSAGAIDPAIGRLTDIVEVSASNSTFAARRGSGHVVAWGNAQYGGQVPTEIAALDDIVQVVGTSAAFAALRKDGTVVAWGDPLYGGNASAVSSQLINVRAIYANTGAFAAVTADSRVVTWGNRSGGGDSSAVQDKLAGKVSYYARTGE